LRRLISHLGLGIGWVVRGWDGVREGMGRRGGVLAWNGMVFPCPQLKILTTEFLNDHSHSYNMEWSRELAIMKGIEISN